MLNRLFMNSTSHNMNWCWALSEYLVLSNALLNQYHQAVYYNPAPGCTGNELFH